MESLVASLLRRLRPRVGWAVFVPALLVALCPSSAAADTTLSLPVWLFVYAGLVGLPFGLRFGRETPSGKTARWRTLLRWSWRLAFAIAFGALLVVAVGQTLPPLGLLWQDLSAAVVWVVRALRRTPDLEPMPIMRSWSYFTTSLARFWNLLQIAPNDGDRGARFMVAVGGVVATWLGSLILGWALAQRRSLFGWGIPILAAITFIATLGGGSVTILVGGMLILLILTLSSGYRRREHAWDQSGADYSDELRFDLLVWGSLAVVLTVSVAFLMPTSVGNPLTDLIWRDVELPSGIAVLERNIDRPKPQPKADVGLSSLPALPLGLSLEEPPPGEVIMRIKLQTPLPQTPWPHYWRARVFNQYTGRDWTQNARINAFPASASLDITIPGTVIQDIEDLRDDRAILVALPDVFAVDVDTQAERLPDGTLAALTRRDGVAHYRVASRPQEYAPVSPVEQPPPDMRPYLGLPRGYSVRVSDLARVIVGTGKTQYEQALALEGYLRALPYVYRVQPLPPGGDAVEQFLFDMQQGYCTYYASAMAVMARNLGIPSRVAVGYATGDYDQASGAYLVRQADAHAWPELFIDGRWQPFEPTPIRALPARNGNDQIEQPQPSEAPAPAPDELRGPLIWALVLAIVAGLTVLGWWWKHPRTAPSLATQVQRELERSGARAGVPWPGGATLHEYAALLAARVGDTREALRDVVDLLARARYGGKPLAGEQESRLRLAAERLFARLKRP